MSADKLVFDLSQEIEGSPQTFIKKDWLNILDNMNQNYQANQTIIDTSQLSNSNKYMSYRESYLAMPMLLTLTGTGYVPPVNGGNTLPTGFAPATSLTSCDYVMGLKNWFGTMIHSFTLDMNGTTIIQQTPFINMVNCFRLVSSLSWGDVITQGSTIGFYPDCATSFALYGVGQAGAGSFTGGQGVCNNTIFPDVIPVYPAAQNVAFANYNSASGNLGLVKRIQMINLDPDGVIGGYGTTVPAGTLPNTTLTSALLQGASAGASTGMRNLWMSHISNKVNGVGGLASVSVLQISVMATVYLKHIHNFFSMCPLLKGTFFKMTAFLNTATTTFEIEGKVLNLANTALTKAGNMTLTSVNVPVGGVNPLMITDCALLGGSYSLGNGVFIANVSVGARCLNTSQASLAGVAQGVLSQSIYLYVPAYTFNPVFETAYLSSPVKSIKYTDFYQYQVQGIVGGGQFNNLITNGIANIKSILIVPYYSLSNVAGALASGLPSGIPVYQSPFDPAGAGMTSPYGLFSNFNCVISGQNSIYNSIRYTFEQWNNQTKGCNSVNGDMTDGLTSGLIGGLDFQTSQCFWYVNVGRQLPVEEAVPKSVQIIGTNQSAFALDLFVFIEYGVAVDIDCLTGARV